MIGSSEKSIFLSALEHERPADRDAYLREACGDDPQLRAAVEGLLAAHERRTTPWIMFPKRSTRFGFGSRSPKESVPKRPRLLNDLSRQGRDVLPARSWGRINSWK